MAIVDINTEFHRITILFRKNVPRALLASESLALLMNNEEDKIIYMMLRSQIISTDEGERLVLVVHPEKFLEVVTRNPATAQVGFIIDNEFLHGEAVELAPKLSRMMFDALAFNSRQNKLQKKPGKVAIFTQSFNEGDMLLYWEAFYGKLVGYENLYVLNNGGTDSSCSRLNKKTVLINMPAGPVDHDHFAQTQGYFQRFLLLKYEWVIKVDTDELLVLENDLVTTLENTAPGTYRPEVAVEIIHDAVKEAPFDWDRSVCTQRKHFVRGTDALLRPIISTVPTTWTAGNHFAHEPSAVMPGLYVAHLKYFDFDFLLRKNNKWSKMEQTENEKKTCVQISGLQELDMRGLRDLSTKEIADRLADDEIPVPAWFVEKL